MLNKEKNSEKQSNNSNISKPSDSTRAGSSTVTTKPQSDEIKSNKIRFNFYKQNTTIRVNWPNKYSQLLTIIQNTYSIPENEVKHLKIYHTDKSNNITIINDQMTYKNVLEFLIKNKRNTLEISIEFTKECKLYNQKLIELKHTRIKDHIKSWNSNVEKHGQEYENLTNINEKISNITLNDNELYWLAIKTLKHFGREARINKCLNKPSHKKIKGKYFKRKMCEIHEQMKLKANTQITNNNLTEENIRKTIIDEFKKFEDELVKKLTPLVIDINSSKFTDIPGAKCTICKIQFNGVRFKCVICPDYYICESCEEKANHVHDMIKERNNKKTNHISKCFVCKNPITEFIFTCSKCINYNLCRSCGQKENHEHDLGKKRINNLR